MAECFNVSVHATAQVLQQAKMHCFVPKIVPTTIQNNQINPIQTKIATGHEERRFVASKGVTGLSALPS